MLETGEVIRCNHTTVRKVDLQVIVSALPEFGNDEENPVIPELLKILNQYRIDLPNLQERSEDVDALIQYFIKQECKEHELDLKQFTPEAKALLLAYPWPGNVSQLHQVVTQAVLKSDSSNIDSDYLPAQLLGTHQDDDESFSMPLVSLAEMEKIHIERVLNHFGGNKKACAEHLGINRSTLYAKLRLYGIE